MYWYLLRNGNVELTFRIYMKFELWSSLHLVYKVVGGTPLSIPFTPPTTFHQDYQNQDKHLTGLLQIISFLKVLGCVCFVLYKYMDVQNSNPGRGCVTLMHLVLNKGISVLAPHFMSFMDFSSRRLLGTNHIFLFMPFKISSSQSLLLSIHISNYS